MAVHAFLLAMSTLTLLFFLWRHASMHRCPKAGFGFVRMQLPDTRPPSQLAKHAKPIALHVCVVGKRQSFALHAHPQGIRFWAAACSRFWVLLMELIRLACRLWIGASLQVVPWCLRVDAYLS
jgi:hypothetical protein